MFSPAYFFTGEQDHTGLGALALPYDRVRLGAFRLPSVPTCLVGGRNLQMMDLNESLALPVLQAWL